MTQTVKTIKPLKVSLFDNSTAKLTAKQVKAKTGADIVFNGSLFSMATLVPCCDVKINGVVKSDDPYGYFGYGWKNGELPQVMHSRDMWAVDNYLSCLWCIHNGEKQTVDDNAVGMGGVRGRTAFGFKADGTMVIICTSDTNGAMKLSQVRDRLYDEACVNGIILDGGGSSQIDTPEEDVTSARIVSNFVCVWYDKTGEIGSNVNDNGQKEDETLSALNIVQPKYAWAYPATLRTETKYIVLHHVGAVGSFTPEQIHAEHLKKGWRGIGYNYYVRKDGTIYHGREENAAGGHTLNYNTVSIGVCFEGNFEIETMPDVQKQAGQKLIADILTRYPNAKPIRHSGLNATACPGKHFPFADITTAPKAETATSSVIYRVTAQCGAYKDKTKANAIKTELEAKGYKVTITEVKA